MAKNSKLKEWEKQHYAQAQKDYEASQRLEAQVKSGEVLLVAPLPTDWRSKMEGKHKIGKYTIKFKLLTISRGWAIGRGCIIFLYGYIYMRCTGVK